MNICKYNADKRMKNGGGKIILILAAILLCSGFLYSKFIPQEAEAGTTRTWVGHTTDMNDGNNYNPTGPLLSTDDLVFNSGATSSIATANLNVGSITTTIGYTGSWSIAGFYATSTSDTGVIFDHSSSTGGTLNLGNGITLTGNSATLHVGHSVGAVTGSNCVLTMKGTTGMTLEVTKTISLKSLILGDNAILVLKTIDTHITGSGVILTLGTNARLTFNSGKSLYLQSNSSGNFMTLNSGYAIVVNGAIYFNVNADNITPTVPALTVTGSGTITYAGNGNGTNRTIQFTGTQNYGSSILLRFMGGSATSQVTHDFNNQSFTCGIFRPGDGNTYTGGGFLTINYTGSQISAASYDGSTGNGTVTENFGTSQWTVSGSWTNGTNHTIDSGTSLITFKNTATITSAGKSFYDITLASSTKTFTMASSTSLHNLTLTAGNYTQLGKILTASGNVNFDGAGTLNLGNGLTMNGASATLHVGSTVGTVTAGSCAVTMNGATAMIFEDNKDITLKTLTLGANAVVTINGISASHYTLFSAATPLTFTNGGTLTINKVLDLTPSNGGSFWSITGSPTINGSGTLNGHVSAGYTVSMPAITASCNAEIYNGAGTLGTLNLTGNVNFDNKTLYIDSSGGSAITFNTQGYSITTGVLSIGATQLAGVLTLNCNSSLISCNSFSVYNNTGTTNVNLQTSQWTVAGNWIYGSNYVVDPGTSLVTFSGTGAHSITSAGKSFYDVNIANTATNGTTFVDPVSLHNLTALKANTQAVSWSGTTLTASGDIIMGGSGTWNAGNGITMNGASGTLLASSSLSTVTAGSCAVTMNGTTGMSITDNKAVNFKTLTLGANAKVTNNGSQSTRYYNSTIPFTMGASSSYTNTQATYFILSGSSDFTSLGAGYTINGGSYMCFFLNANSLAVTLPAITTTNVQLIIGENGANETGWTYQLTGPMNLGTGSLITRVYNSGSSGTFDFNNQSITCGTFQPGSYVAGATSNINYTGSVISISNYNGTVDNLGTINENFGTSQWTVSGNWTNGSNHTIDPGTSLITFKNTATITSAGKNFYDITLASSSKTFTLASSTTAHTLNLSAGTLNTNAKNVSLSGDINLTAGTTFTTAGSVFTFTGTPTVTATSHSFPQSTFNNGAVFADDVTFTRAIFTPNKTYTFHSGNNFTLSSYTSGDWDGTAGNPITLQSSLADSAWNFINSTGMIVLYESVKDSSASNDITATSPTNTNNGGNNAHWIFDISSPVIDSFTAPATSNSLTITLTPFTAHDNIAVTGYLVNESSSTPLLTDLYWETTATTTYTFASAGNKTLYAWARDAAGNISASANAGVVVDISVPVIDSFTAPPTSNSLTIALTPFIAHDNTAVTSYLVNESALIPSLANPAWETTATTTYTFVSAGNKTLYAWARDAAGNISASANAGVVIDISAPTVSLTAPAAESFLRGSFVNVAATTTDNIAVVGVQFKLDNVNLETEDTAIPFSINWNTTLAANGAHSLTAIARDAAGNITTSSPISVTVDNSVPTISFLVPSNGSIVSGSSVNISADANDNIGVIGVQYQLDNANFQVEQTVYPYLITWDTTTATSGSHSLRAIARDEAGNITTSTPISVTVDNIAPIIAITTPVAGALMNGHSVVITASSSDNVAVVGVQLKIDGANLGTELTSAPYSIIWDSAQVINGAHIFTAVARDFAGHETESAAIAVTVFNAVPPTGGGGGSIQHEPPFPPLGGFKIFINDNAAETNSIFVTLNLIAGSDSARMAISNTPDFNNASQETYQPTKIWNICQGLSSCMEGEHTVYVKFYNVFGLSSGAVFDSIIYNLNAIIEKPIVTPPPVIVPPVVKPGEPTPTPVTTPETKPEVPVPPKKPIIENIIPPIIGNIIPPVIEGVGNIIQPIIPIINGIFNPPKEQKPPEIPIEQVVKQIPPISLMGRWTLIDQSRLSEFALAPLPSSITNLAKKFPELNKTLQEVGVGKITDVSKLSGISLTLPGLSDSAGISPSNIESGKFAIPKGIPLAELSVEAKAKIPTNIVFANTDGLIDINNTLTLNSKGDSELTTSVISGQKMHLTIKPDLPAKGVTGYVVFRSKNKINVSYNFSLEDLMASAMFASPAFAQEQAEPIQLEEKLVLSQFEYQYAGDGIFTADINAPVVDGQYEIISVIKYVDENLSPKAVHMITVVDPEGYVYEAKDGKELRIPGAVISLYWLNPETKQYALWPAKDYQQENDQITGMSGTYSFLVPPGMYYLKASAPGYLAYENKPFEVVQGGGIHENIQLKSKFWWLSILDWKTLLLVIAILLILYNFYRDKLRDISAKNKK
jgi:hypothetical protein